MKEEIAESHVTASSTERKAGAGLILAAMALVLTSQILSLNLPFQLKERYWVSIGLTGAGLLLFLLGGFTVERGRLPRWFAKISGAVCRWLDIALWQLFFLITGILFAILATVAAGYEEKMINLPVATISWGLAVILTVLGCWWGALPKLKPSMKTVIIATLLFILAFGLRAFDTTNIPNTLSGDEASAGLYAARFADGQVDNIFSIGWFSFPSLFFKIQSLLIPVMGHTTPAIRIPSALVGAVTVVALYFLARKMFGQTTGIIAAAVLACSHFHINFSRIALNNIWDAFFYVIALGALWHGSQYGKRASFVLAGLAMGLSQYFYSSSHFLPVIALFFIILTIGKKFSDFKRNLPNYVIMAVIALVVVLPLAWFYATHPTEFLAPMQRVSVTGDWLQNEIRNTGLSAWAIILRQLGDSFLGFTNLPTKVWYSPGTPILRTLPGVFFLLGIMLLFTKLREKAFKLILCWLLAFIIVGGLSESTPAAQRYVAAAPMCALLVGYAIATVSSLLAGVWPRLKRWLYVLITVITLFICLDDLRFYFWEYTPKSDFGGENTLVAQRLADFLKDKPDTWQVYFFGAPRMGYYSISSLPYLAPQIKGFDMYYPWGAPENPVPSSDDLAFVFLPGLERELAAVQRDYPGGFLIIQNGRTRKVLYYLYEYSKSNNAPYP